MKQVTHNDFQTGAWNRLMVACGRYPALPAFLGVLASVLICSLLLFGTVLNKLPVEMRMQWAVGVAVPTWFLVNGLLSALCVGWYECDKAGSKVLVGMASAVAAVILLVGGTIAFWLQ